MKPLTQAGNKSIASTLNAAAYASKPITDEVAEALKADAAGQIVPPVQPAPDTVQTLDPAPSPGSIIPTILAHAEPRRDPIAPKVMRHLDEISYAERAKELGALEGARQAEKQQVRFMSIYKDLQIYVPLGSVKDLPVKFKHGVFNTSNEDLAEAIRAHPRCNTVLFREEKDARLVAVREAAAKQREAMRTPAFAGPTASSDGNEALFHKQDSELSAVEHQAINFGTL